MRAGSSGSKVQYVASFDLRNEESLSVAEHALLGCLFGGAPVDDFPLPRTVDFGPTRATLRASHIVRDLTSIVRVESEPNEARVES